MNKKYIIVLLVLAMFGLTSCFKSTETQTNNTTNTTVSEGNTEKETSVSSSVSFEGAPFSYRAYNGQDLSNIGQKTVLFFFQASCSTCQKTHADLVAQSELPEGVNIINIDFDSETELKEKYGVTTKHTFVLIDENGEMLASEIGLASTEEIAAFVSESSSSQEDVIDKREETVSVEEISSTEVNIQTETSVVVEEELVAPIAAASSAGMYKEYNGSVPANSVLFFHAPWCPSCVAADKGFSSESELEIDADIIKVDYDSNEELRKKYGITYQHSFVLVDDNGDLVKKSTGARTSRDLTDLFN